MKVIKIVLYSLIVALIAQTFIISCPTCFKPTTTQEKTSENQVRGNGDQSVIGEMGTGSSQITKNNPLMQVVAAQNSATQGAPQ